MAAAKEVLVAMSTTYREYIYIWNKLQFIVLSLPRYFIPVRHQPYFDAIVNQNYAGSGSDNYSPRNAFGNSPREQLAVPQSELNPKISSTGSARSKWVTTFNQFDS